jgi:hypothetical protein
MASAHAQGHLDDGIRRLRLSNIRGTPCARHSDSACLQPLGEDRPQRHALRLRDDSQCQAMPAQINAHALATSHRARRNFSGAAGRGCGGHYFHYQHPGRGASPRQASATTCASSCPVRPAQHHGQAGLVNQGPPLSHPLAGPLDEWGLRRHLESGTSCARPPPARPGLDPVRVRASAVTVPALHAGQCTEPRQQCEYPLRWPATRKQ